MTKEKKTIWFIIAFETILFIEGTLKLTKCGVCDLPQYLALLFGFFISV